MMSKAHLKLRLLTDYCTLRSVTKRSKASHNKSRLLVRIYYSNKTNQRGNKRTVMNMQTLKNV